VAFTALETAFPLEEKEMCNHEADKMSFQVLRVPGEAIPELKTLLEGHLSVCR
jgi:hypothetical protein